MSLLSSRILLYSTLIFSAIATTRIVAAEPDTALAELVGPKTPLKSGMKIAFFGDSITMQGGYIEKIKNEIAKSESTKNLNIEIFRHGLNGGRIPTILEGKTPWGKLGGTMQDILAKEKPDLVVIFAGINDVWHGAKGTTPEDFRAGILEMVNLAKADGVKVVLATLAVLGEKPDGQNSEDAKLDQYAGITLDVAKETGATPVDLRKKFLEYLAKNNTKPNEKGELPRQGFLTYDGVHMSEKGNSLLAELFAQGILDALRPM